MTALAHLLSAVSSDSPSEGGPFGRQWRTAASADESRALNESDARVAEHIRAGDDNAFAALFHELYAELVGYSTHLGLDPYAAEDTVQIVFVELWRNRAEFFPVAGIRALLFTSVRFRASDRIRSDRRRTGSHEAASHAGERAEAQSAQEALELSELDAAIRAAIAELPARAREALILVREHGLSYQEAANVMGVSVNTVKTQLTRAVATLRLAVGPLLVLVIAPAIF